MTISIDGDVENSGPLFLSVLFVVTQLYTGTWLMLNLVLKDGGAL